MALKDDIFASDDLGIIPVPTPEWSKADGKLFIRQMTGKERLQWELGIYDGTGAVDRVKLFTSLLTFTVVDADGKQVFDTEGDVAKLMDKFIAPIQRLFDVSMKVNELSKTDIDEIIKNSSTIRSTSGA